jgi:hypothetical protein
VGGYGAESRHRLFSPIFPPSGDALPDGVAASIWYSVDYGVSTIRDDRNRGRYAAQEHAPVLVLAAAFLLLARWRPELLKRKS